MSEKSYTPQALFVYGTLLQESGSEMAEFIKLHVTDLGKGYIFGRLYNLGEYPGAIAGNAEVGKVFGHVYQLQEAGNLLPVLDAYEGYSPDNPNPDLFSRAVVEVYFQNTVKKCWAYFFNGPVSEAYRISSGDYLKHLHGE